MRTYTSILLLSLLSIAFRGNFQDIVSPSTKQVSETVSDLLTSDRAGKLKDSRCENNPHCGRGSGRRDFSQIHQDLITLA